MESAFISITEFRSQCMYIKIPYQQSLSTESEVLVVWTIGKFKEVPMGVLCLRNEILIPGSVQKLVKKYKTMV